MRKRGLPPLLAARAEVLVLGSFPSVASLAAREYYAHPQNHFWKIMAALSGRELFGEADERYAERRQAAAGLHIAIWDVIAACERAGSGDERIENARINNFARLSAEAPQLRRVCFNGQAAAKLGRPVFEGLKTGAGRDYEICVLPSTSPRHASMTLARKTEIWREAVVIKRR
jgi:hypoxanthine-DNA glycosylase